MLFYGVIALAQTLASILYPSSNASRPGDAPFMWYGVGRSTFWLQAEGSSSEKNIPLSHWNGRVLVLALLIRAVMVIAASGVLKCEYLLDSFGSVTYIPVLQ